MIKKLLLTFSALFTFFAVAVTPAFAGTDLTVNCPAIGTCNISPAATPLYNEGGWLPGSTVTQRLRMTNSSSQNGFTGIQVANYSELKNLGQVISIDIRKGSPLGPQLYFRTDLHTFRDDGYFTIDGINAGQTTDYYFVATMSPTAGNEYQESQVKFDLNVGLEITPIAPPSGPPTSGGGGSVQGTSTSGPTVCSDAAPTSAPNVTITNVGTNTVTLSWTPVSPVTHYALFFTRNSDGAQYGASNIGNVTSYTITNLSGGANYTFQVMGVNGCQPGPRSANATTGVVPGGATTGRPLGLNGQVLGVSTEVSPTPSPSLLPTPSASPIIGSVAGATTEICTNWRLYVPWILLVVQFIFVLFFEYRYRDDNGPTKHFLAILITAVSIILFYFLKECDCYGDRSWLAWLCKWYWVVAIILTLLIKGFSYAFLDESGEREVPPKVMKTEKTTTSTASSPSPASVSAASSTTETTKTTEKSSS